MPASGRRQAVPGGATRETAAVAALSCLCPMLRNGCSKMYTTLNAETSTLNPMINQQVPTYGLSMMISLWIAMLSPKRGMNPKHTFSLCLSHTCCMRLSRLRILSHLKPFQRCSMLGVCLDSNNPAFFLTFKENVYGLLRVQVYRD